MHYIGFSSHTLVTCGVNNTVAVIGASKRWFVITFQPGSGANWGYFLSNTKTIYPPTFPSQHVGNSKFIMLSMLDQELYTLLKNILDFLVLLITVLFRIMFNDSLFSVIFSVNNIYCRIKISKVGYRKRQLNTKYLFALSYKYYTNTYEDVVLFFKFGYGQR